MTTFTLQELNLPTTADQAVEQVTKEKWMEYGMNNPISASVTNEETLINMGKALANHEVAHQQAQQNLLNSIPQPTTEDILNHIALPQVPEPQPTTGTNVPDITSTINNICLQLHALFTTVINQTKAQPDTTPPEPLQETIELLLKQSDWFKEMVRSAVEDAFDIEDYAKEAVEDVVESKVDSYFNSSFDASDHFDFHDAVSDCVSDQIHDAVSDKIDGAVEEYMSNATITIQRS